MNERVAQAGNQVREAFGKLAEAWKNQEAKRKKTIITVALLVLAAVIAIVVIINVVGGRYVVLYNGQLSGDEVTTAALALQSADIPFTRNQSGQLMVPSRMENKAIMQLAAVGVPSTKLSYDIFAQGSGLLTSETERSQYALQQVQDNLATIIKSTDGVKNAFVLITLAEGKTWDVNRSRGSASVKVEMNPGATLTPSQIEGIRYYVSTAIDVEKTAVTIIDGNNSVLAAAGEETLSSNSELATVKERLDLEDYMSEELRQKADAFLRLMYPEGDKYVVVPYVKVDYDQVVKELKEYTPLDDTIHGVTVYEEIQALLGFSQYAGGVVGEDTNTDVPTQADLDGDGETDAVDFSRIREYLVSYELTQTTKEGPTMVEAGISVLIDDSITTERQVTLRDAISNATGIPAERVYVGASLSTAIDESPGIGDGTTSTIIPGVPDWILFAAIAAVIFLVFVLILIILLRSRAKKRRLAEEQASAMAELEEQERIQMEIEQRKLELKNAALSESSEDAIINEVRDFARSNPDITANLLRNWLKESEG